MPIVAFLPIMKTNYQATRRKFIITRPILKTIQPGILTGAGKEKWPANNGIVQQYYVEDSHPAIINKEEFAAVQAEFVKRSSMRGYSKMGKSTYTSEYPFSGKLFCQNCGSKFRSQAWGKGKNKKYVWRCINREHNGVDSCSTKPLKEMDLEQAFLRAIKTVIGGQEAFIKTLMKNINKGLEQEDTMEQIDLRLTELQQELMSLVRVKFDEKEYSSLVTEIELMQERRQKLKETEAERVLRDGRINEIKAYLAAQDSLLDKFDGDIFRRLIEKVKVESMVEVGLYSRQGLT